MELMAFRVPTELRAMLATVAYANGESLSTTMRRVLANGLSSELQKVRSK